MLEGRKVSFKGVREFVEREMQEEMRTGVVKPMPGSEKMQPDELALFFHMITHFDGTSQAETLEQLEQKYHQKFDAESLVPRLEAHYEAVLVGTEVCQYVGGLDSMRQDMDRLRYKAGV